MNDSDTRTLDNVQDLSRCVWKNYKILANFPEASSTAREATLSVYGALQLIHECVEGNSLSSTDRRTLDDQLGRCRTVIVELNDVLRGFWSQDAAVETVSNLARKLWQQAGRLSSMYDTLRRYSQEGILNALEATGRTKPDVLQQSVNGDFTSLFAELEGLGISQDALFEERHFIHEWLKDTNSKCASEPVAIPSQDTSLSNHETVHTETRPRIELIPEGLEIDEELPDYTPGKAKKSVAEKVQSLELGSALLSSNSHVEPALSNSKHAPPAYTFEEGNDQEMDEEFSRYIAKAVDFEFNRRYLQHTKFPELAPRPYSWLPKNIQAMYSGRLDVVQLLAADSFTAMAYETAPSCVAEIDRLLPFIRMSMEDSTRSGQGIISEALGCLDTLIQAMSKFRHCQNQKSDRHNFSDLDALDYEFSTAAATNENLQFPDKEFERAQKTHYLLLTYSMGILALFKDIFPGRTHITRLRTDYEQLWKERRMGARTAWVEKQLATWDQVDTAVLKCRDWYRLRPNLRNEAILTLNAWHKYQGMLVSQDLREQIEITILSISNLPKSRTKFPNVVVKVVVYAAKATGALRTLESCTDAIKNTQNPTWNKLIVIPCPPNPKMIDFEIHDRGLGRDKEMTRHRLNFSYIPGVELNFAERSLMYGLDEEFSYPLKFTEGKGKEVEQPMLNIGLKWAGRTTLLADSGLPTSPPGKMFTKVGTGIPLPLMEMDLSSIQDERGRSNSGAGLSAQQVLRGTSELASGSVNLLDKL